MKVNRQKAIIQQTPIFYAIVANNRFLVPMRRENSNSQQQGYGTSKNKKVSSNNIFLALCLSSANKSVNIWLNESGRSSYVTSKSNPLFYKRQHTIQGIGFPAIYWVSISNNYHDVSREIKLIYSVEIIHKKYCVIVFMITQQQAQA